MKKYITITALAFVSLFILTGCVPGVSETETPPPAQQDELVPTKNTDPRNGWVTVFKSADSKLDGDGNYMRITVYKRCDKTTLVYISIDYASTSVIQNSPECTTT